MPDWGQAGAAATVIGMCVGTLVMLSRGKLWPAPRNPHKVFVDLYAGPMLGSGRYAEVLPPPANDGHYQARCRCGWRGTTHNMDLDTAEAEAAADAEEHLQKVQRIAHAVRF
jgi:hypothetical protein